MCLASAVEACQTLLGDGTVRFAVDKGNFFVSVCAKVIHDAADTLDVIGHNRRPVIENVVNGDKRQVAVCQLHDLRVIELDTGGDHPVHPALPAMLQVAGTSAPDIVIDKGDIVTAAFRAALEGVQYCGEEFVGKTALRLVHKQNA